MPKTKTPKTPPAPAPPQRRRRTRTAWQKHRAKFLIDLDLDTSDIAEALGENKQTISAIFLDQFRSPRVEPLICEFLGVDRDFMGWPEEGEPGKVPTPTRSAAWLAALRKDPSPAMQWVAARTQERQREAGAC